MELPVTVTAKPGEAFGHICMRATKPADRARLFIGRSLQWVNFSDGSVV